MLLGLSGAELAFYSPLLPVPPVLSGGVVIQIAGGRFGIGWALSTLGAAAILAAVGVWWGRRWGRIAAAVVTVTNLAYQVWYQTKVMSPESGWLEALGWMLVGLVLPTAASAFILFVLVWRWTAPTRPARAALRDPGD